VALASGGGVAYMIQVEKDFQVILMDLKF